MREQKNSYKMKKLRQQQGITIVALTTTVIVLFIIAGVTIGIATNENNLLGRAKNQTNRYAEEAAETDMSTKNVINTIDNSSRVSDFIIQPVYELGQEVIVGEESFYVIETSDSTQNTVTLLAKYNLNKAGTAQAPNAAYSDTGVIFSSENYWASAHSEYTNWSTKKLDINTINGEVAGDAIYKAKQYAESKGGTKGRLMTYEEADSLKTRYPNIINGKENKQGETNNYYLFYWLSSAFQTSNLYAWYMNGNEGILNCGFDYDYSDSLGVRPVITVSKSLVQGAPLKDSITNADY